MALSIKVTADDKFGNSATFNTAYVRVGQVNSTKYSASATVTTYTQAPTTENSSPSVISIKNYNFIPTMTNANFINQAYLYLKTLPDFIGATDC